MSKPTYDKLLEELPRIAEAVNSFKSDAVQQEVFATLTSALAGEPIVKAKEREQGKAQRKAASKPREASKKGTKRSVPQPSIVKSLSLRPKGKDSLREFVDSKKSPSTNGERALLSLYYLEKVAEIEDDLTIDHVYSCFKDMSWRVPTNLYNALQVVASTKGWIDTSNMGSITVTVKGEEYVEHDLTLSTG